MAIKISIETYTIDGNFDGLGNSELVNAVEENLKNCCIGVGLEDNWKKSVENNTNCLWSLAYDQSEDVLKGYISQY
jgi:hypothetical protein